MLSWIVALLCVTAPAVSGGALVTEERCAKWLRALQEGDMWNARRALQEILASKEKGEPVAQALYTLAWHSPDWLGVDPDILALPLRETLSLSDCRKLLLPNPSGSDQPTHIACCAVSAMGGGAKTYLAFLQNVVSAEGELTPRKIMAEVALASLGNLKEKALTDVSSALHATNRLRTIVLRELAFARNNDWFTEELRRELCVIAEQGTGESAFAALAVARFAQQSPAYREALAKGLRQTHAVSPGSENVRMFYGFAVTKARGCGSPEAFREALKSLGDPYYVGLENGGIAIIVLVRYLLDKNQIETFVKLVDDTDPVVALGAAKVCWGFGVDAQKAQKGLFRLLEKRPDEEGRFVAAFAIGMVAGEEVVPELERFAAKEKVSFVREEIDRSIRMIRLEPRKDLTRPR